MTRRTLYTVVISSDAQTQDRGDASQRLSALGLLSSDVGSVEEIASEPGQRRLDVQFRDPLAEEMVDELEELSASGSIGAVPYYGTSTKTPIDGYYSVGQVRESGRSDPRASEVAGAVGVLTQTGTRRSHSRSVEMSKPIQRDHPFGNDTRGLVGVPAAASNLRLYNEETGATSIPPLVSTRSAELGDVEIYDAQAMSVSPPTLIYDLPYGDQGAVDPRLWDTHGRGDRTDANGNLQWQKVFAAGHEFDGKAILSNGLVRLIVDESVPSLSVETWDDGTQSWGSTSLGTSDWEPYDLDLRSVGLAQVTGVMRFRDTTQSPTAYDWLHVALKRGYTWPLFYEDADASGTESGLVDLLDPVASEVIYDPTESAGLVARSEVN